ncbi:MAG: hypothetical protein ACREOC_10705 [Gemmatimonadales bacterium]
MIFPLNGRARRALLAGFCFCVAYASLAIPEPDPDAPRAERVAGTQFVWDRDSIWSALERRFRNAAALGCATLRDSMDAGFRRGEALAAALRRGRVDHTAVILDTLEENTFALGTLVGACPERLPAYADLVTRTRSEVKRQSEQWDLAEGKDRLYRLLWGGRAALEEVMLQSDVRAVPALVLADQEPSATPSTRILGVTIHSGDILVSRGGAPTSALIAVGSDYPGNFSHVALVHVDRKTSLPTILQSSEIGLHRTTLEQYLSDVKLRVMVLRVRADLPELVADPMLPHRAAERVLDRARRGHTPYDFAIDHRDDSRLTCSEVAAWAYAGEGVRLWMRISRVSRPSTRAWLARLGVRSFDLQEPSDLEYDPQLRVVAEWREPGTLYVDHVDNVVTEVMLDGALHGDSLEHAWYALPVVRVLKGYSAALNLVPLTGPVPEGLGGVAAARVLALNGRHTAIRRRTLRLADEFRRTQGYPPPEWQLLRLAKQARDDLR